MHATVHHTCAPPGTKFACQVLHLLLGCQRADSSSVHLVSQQVKLMQSIDPAQQHQQVATEEQYAVLL